MPDEPDIADDDATKIEKEDLDAKEKKEIREPKERSYYYDDSHGYKDFDPGSEDEEESND